MPDLTPTILTRRRPAQPKACPTTTNLGFMANFIFSCVWFQYGRDGLELASGQFYSFGLILGFQLILGFHTIFLYLSLILGSRVDFKVRSQF